LELGFELDPEEKERDPPLLLREKPELDERPDE